MTTRRALLTATLFAAPTSLLLSEPARAALPTVDMEALLKAAQWDPVKLDTGITAGAGASVLQVEKALVAKGLLAASYADGTTEAAPSRPTRRGKNPWGTAESEPTAYPAQRPWPPWRRIASPSSGHWHRAPRLPSAG